MRNAMASALCVVAVLASACSSTSPGPSSTSPFAPGSAAAAGRPAGRAGAALGYDPVSRQLVLVGGMADPRAPLAGDDVPGQDMWAWKPDSGWVRLNPAILPDVGYLAWLAWSPAIGRLLLVGQSSSNLWAWDGRNWSPISSVPSHDVLSGVGFDTDQSELRMLGRQSAGGLEAMWSWDGSSWTGAGPLPMSWREQSVVAYDQARRQLVVYGGFGDGDTATWLFDGTTWNRSEAGPAPQAGQSSAAYDPERREVVVHTGNQTWTWDGSAWILRSTAGPALRRDEAMAFDPAIGKVVLFGGQVLNGSGETMANDLWAWDGTDWSRIG